MKVLTWLVILILATPCWAASGQEDRREAEYYVAAYAQHYRVPVEFVRALVEQESAYGVKSKESTQARTSWCVLLPALEKSRPRWRGAAA